MKHPINTYTCKLPCKEMKIKVEHVVSFKMDGFEFIELRVQPKVMIIRQEASYSIFDLIVEVGSALGLWIGLSVLGVFNVMLEYLQHFKSLLGNKKIIKK